VVTPVFGRLIRSVALWPPRFDASLRRRMLHLSLPLVAFTVSQYVIRSVDLIVIGAFASVAAAGIYAVAYQGYVVLQQMTTASGPVLTPLFVSLRAAGSERLVDRYVERVIPQLTLVGAVLVGLALPLVPIAVPILFGDAFGGAADPLAILLLAIVVGFTANLLAPVIVLHERTLPVGVVNVAAAAVNIVGDIVLVGPAGLDLTGPAIATTAAMALILVGYVAIVRDVSTARCRIPVAASLPAVAGFIPAVALGGIAGVAVGVPATLIVAALVILIARPFERADLDLISRLDMPQPLKRLTIRMLELTAR
jgi:O-antigen/teichoic acid export membrane protein